MEYELLLLNNLGIIEVRNIIIAYVDKELNQEVKYEENSDNYYIGYQGCSIFIDKENEDIAVVEDLFGIKLNVDIEIQIFGNMFEKGVLFVFDLLVELLKNSTTNMLLLENGDTEIFRKEDEKYLFIKNMDKYQLKYLPRIIKIFEQKLHS